MVDGGKCKLWEPMIEIEGTAALDSYHLHNFASAISFKHRSRNYSLLKGVSFLKVNIPF
jgi:hypothetical protein